MLVSDFFYTSLTSFFLIISITYFQPLSFFFVTQHPYISLPQKFFSSVSFLLFFPFIIFNFIFLLFSICYSKFLPSVPKLLVANKHLKKYIFLYYDIVNRAHAPTTEEVIFTFTLQFFLPDSVGCELFYLSSSHGASTGRVLCCRIHQHP